jgi:hypothetical protein
MLRGTANGALEAETGQSRLLPGMSLAEGRPTQETVCLVVAQKIALADKEGGNHLPINNAVRLFRRRLI